MRTYRLLLFMMAVTVGLLFHGNAYAADEANRLELQQEITVDEGTTEVVLPISLVNETKMTGFQCDLYLPEGFTVATDKYDDYLMDMARTTAKRHSLAAREMDDGALRIVLSSMTNATFSGNSGVVEKVTNSEAMFGGCYKLMGGKGTVYNENYTDATYARIDGGATAPGYFMAKGLLEPYAVLSNDNTVLTFYYGKDRLERDGMLIEPFDSWEDRGWNDVDSLIERVVFDESFAECKEVTSTAYWFCDCKGLKAIEGLGNLNTSNVTSMYAMFYGCSSLTSLDLSSFNTSNVTNMDSMFGDCSSLTSLDLSSFNTSNVTDMSWMFDGCSSLTSLDLSSFNTSNVTYMNAMFYGCSSLTSLDLSSFNTSNVTNMIDIFSECSALERIYVGEEWSTEKVIYSDEMFTGCAKLVGGMGTMYDSNHTDATYARIDGGTETPGYFTEYATGITNVLASGKPFDVYTLKGHKVRHQVTSVEGLPKGVYIVAGRKFVVR